MVSMGSPLGPTLADIIMTALEDAIIKPLINSGVLKFYSRFVDDIHLSWLNRLTFLLFCSFLLILSLMIKIFISLTSKLHRMELLFIANLLIQDNTYTYLVLHLGIEKLLGYVHLFIVLINSAVTVRFCLSDFLKFTSSLLGMVSLNVLLRTFSNNLLLMQLII